MNNKSTKKTKIWNFMFIQFGQDEWRREREAHVFLISTVFQQKKKLI